MNNWFYLALIAPVLWAVVNHIDKYLLSKVFANKGIGSIFIFSGLFSIFVVIGIVSFFDSSVFSLPIRDILILLITGSLNGFAFYLYLYALKDEETSVVVPLLQMTPVFVYLLGYIILGEILNTNQLIAAVIVLSGVLLISINFEIDNQIKIKYNVLLIMTISSLLFALHDVLFKFVAIKDSFLNSTFWQYLGIFLVSLFTFIFSKIHRNQFLLMIKLNKVKIFSLNIISELFYVIGNLASNFATLLVPVVLVSIISSYQPLFVFIGGILLTIFFSHISEEKLSVKHFIQKLVSIIIIILGSYMLYISSN